MNDAMLGSDKTEIIDRMLVIGQAIQQHITQNPQQVYQLIVKAVCEMTGADCAVIYPYHPAFGEFYDADNVAAHGLRHPLQLEKKPKRGLAALVHREGEVARENIELEDPPLLKESRFIAREDIKAFMSLSLQMDHNVLGILYVDYRKPHYFSEEEKKIIRLLGQQAALAISNSWTSRLAGIRAQTIAKLRAVGQMLITIEDPTQTLDDLLGEIARTAQEVLDADIVDLYQYFQVQNEFVLPPTLVGERWHPHVPKVKIYDDDVVMRAVKIAEPQYHHDAQGTALLTGKFEVPRDDAPEQRFVVREGVVSSATIPLIAASETVGVMFVNYRTPQIFGPEQRDVIESFAAQAAIAIYNARLLQSEQAQRQQSETLREVAQIVNSTLERSEVPGLVLDQLRKVIEYDSASIQLIQGDRRIVVGARGFLVEDSPPELRRDVSQDPLVRKIVQARKPLVLSDVKDEPLWDHLPQTARVNSWIGVPLVVRDQVIGLMTLDHKKAGHYNPESGEVVAAFANQVATAIHNTNLFQQVTDQARALTELNELAPQLVSIEASPEDTKNLLQRVARSAQEVLKADLIELYEYEQERNEYRLPQVSVGERIGPPVPKDKIYPDDAVFQLIRREKPLYVARVQAEPILSGPYTVERRDQPTERFVVREGIQSTATIPLRTGRETVGLMFASFRTPQAFTPEQKQVIELFANQAAIAIYNSRLFNALKHRVQALTTLNEVGQTLTSGIRLREEEILELTYEQARRLTATQNIYIALYEEETDTINFRWVMERGQRVDVEHHKGFAPRKINKVQRGKTEEIILTRKPILHRTKSEAVAWYDEPGHREYIGEVSASHLAVPMAIGERVRGVIAIYDWEREHAYDEQDLQILSSMANQAAIALDNANLYYEVNQALERRVQALTALNEVGQTLTSGIRLQEKLILELIQAQASKLMPMDNMYIALYDDATDTVRFGLAMQRGKRLPDEYFQPGSDSGWVPRSGGAGRTEGIIRAQKPIFHKTRTEAKAWYAQAGRKEYIGETFASWIGVPMMVGEKVLGVIAAYHPDLDYAYDENDLQVLTTLASQAAIALDNANLLTKYATMREELIATKQVATLGTAMAAIQHRINNTLNIIGPNLIRLRRRVDMSDETIQEVLDIIERNTQYTSDYVTRIQEPLTETEVQLVDINASLREAQAQVQQQYQAGFEVVEVIYKLDDSLPLIEASLGQITEIFSNLIDNSYRAMAPSGGTLTIASRRVDNQLEVEIQDSGPGIPPSIRDRLFIKPVPSREPGAGSGLGLWLTKLLLQRYGGEIIIKSSGADGTTMCVRLPASKLLKQI